MGSTAKTNITLKQRAVYRLFHMVTSTVSIAATKKNQMIEYDDALIQDYIEHIIVQSRKEVIFELKCGLKFPERLV